MSGRPARWGMLGRGFGTRRPRSGWGVGTSTRCGRCGARSPARERCDAPGGAARRPPRSGLERLGAVGFGGLLGAGAVEELDEVGDDLVLGAGAGVGGPLGVVEAAGD